MIEARRIAYLLEAGRELYITSADDVALSCTDYNKSLQMLILCGRVNMPSIEAPKVIILER